MTEIFHSLNMRSQHGSIFRLNSHNRTLWFAGIFSLLATTLVISVPFLRDAFGFTVITLPEYAVALGLAALVIPVVEIVKLVQRIINKKKETVS